MTKSKRTQKKVAKMAASVASEQQVIEKAIEAEVVTPVVRRTVILPEGMSGKQLARKVIPQTAAKAAELNPNLKPNVEKAKEAAKSGLEPKRSIVTVAKEKKAEKSGKTAKTKKEKAAKYVEGITSMEKLGDYCLAQGWDENSKETQKIFLDAYKQKNSLTEVTKEMLAFIKPRVVIYMNIARKHASKVAIPLTKPEKAVKKEAITVK